MNDENRIQKKQQGVLLRFLEQFYGPILTVIGVAAVIAAISQEWYEFVAILLLLIINALTIVFLSRKTEKALNTIKAKLKITPQHTLFFQADAIKVRQFLIILNFIGIAVIILDAICIAPHHVNWWKEISFCLLLSVAVIPIALTTALKAIMAQGAKKLSINNATLNNFAAIEKIARMNVLCLDQADLSDLETTPDIANTVETLKKHGIELKLFAKDHEDISQKTCRLLGIEPNILNASTLTPLPDRKASQLVENNNTFCQLSPELKYEIVELLQKNNHIVGTTGSETDDIPPLKKADVGMARSGTTNPTKSAADIIFTIPVLSVILNTIKESRSILQQMRFYLNCRTANSIQLLLFTVIAVLIGGRFPLTPLMIITLALFYNFPIIPKMSDTGTDPKWRIGILNAVFTLAVFALGYNLLLKDPGICNVGGQVVNHIVEGGKILFPAVNNYQFAPIWIKKILPSLTFFQLQTIAFLLLLILSFSNAFICRKSFTTLL